MTPVYVPTGCEAETLRRAARSNVALAPVAIVASFVGVTRGPTYCSAGSDRVGRLPQSAWLRIEMPKPPGVPIGQVVGVVAANGAMTSRAWSRRIRRSRRSARARRDAHVVDVTLERRRTGDVVADCDRSGGTIDGADVGDDRTAYLSVHVQGQLLGRVADDERPRSSGARALRAPSPRLRADAHACARTKLLAVVVPIRVTLGVIGTPQGVVDPQYMGLDHGRKRPLRNHALSGRAPDARCVPAPGYGRSCSPPTRSNASVDRRSSTSERHHRRGLRRAVPGCAGACAGRRRS